MPLLAPRTVLALSLGFAAAGAAHADYLCDFKRGAAAAWTSANAAKSFTDPVAVFAADHTAPITFRCRHSSAPIADASVILGYDTANIGTATTTYSGVSYKEFTLPLGGTVRLDWGVNDYAYVMATDNTLPASPVFRRNIAFTNGVDSITQGGTYVLNGSATGRIQVSTTDPVVIVGKGQAKLTTPANGAAGFDSNKGAIHGDTGSKVTVKGVRVVIPDQGMFGIWLTGQAAVGSADASVIQQSAVVSGDTIGTQRGRGGMETGAGGRIENNIIVPGDDAIRLTDHDTSASKNIVHMLGNGNVFQLGWGQKFNGNNHNADKTRVYGQIRIHAGHDYSWTEPARAVLSGSAPVNGGAIAITNLDLRMDALEAYLKVFTFTCDGEALARNLCVQGVPIGPVDINGVTFSGSVRGTPVLSYFSGTAGTYKYPINLRALESTQKIRGVAITLTENGSSNFPVSNGGTNYQTPQNSSYVTGNVAGTVGSTGSSWTIVSPNQPTRP